MEKLYTCLLGQKLNKFEKFGGCTSRHVIYNTLVLYFVLLAPVDCRTDFSI